MRTPQGKCIGDLPPITRLMHREDRSWRPTVYGRVAYEAECALLDAGGKIKYSHIKEKQGNNRHRYKTRAEVTVCHLLNILGICMVLRKNELSTSGHPIFT